ncbi:Heparanase-like protein 1 [Nymphaea thermarum]|nr:Heparanase-like protein 1 [Nymphaea thermarum]
MVKEGRVDLANVVASPKDIFCSFLLWLVVFQVVAEGQEPVTVTVNGVTAIAETDDNFVCATLDWWPPNKCNYNQCPWGRASVLNLVGFVLVFLLAILNLENRILQKAIKPFNPLRIRIGGSLQDQVVYQIGEHGRQCPTFRKTNDGLFGFSRGCLPMKRWDEIAQTFKDLQQTIQEFGPWSSAWVGESGGAYNSGGRLVSNTFINSFWYLDQLGMSSTFNTKAYCRQALIGGNYALLNTTTFVPNPDYYRHICSSGYFLFSVTCSALLWHRLMGNKYVSHSVIKLEIILFIPLKCSNLTLPLKYFVTIFEITELNHTGITLLLINLSNTTTFHITVRDDVNLVPIEVSAESPQREEYKLMPEDGNLVSQTMLLNGRPLELTEMGISLLYRPPLLMETSQ